MGMGIRLRSRPRQQVVPGEASPFRWCYTVFCTATSWALRFRCAIHGWLRPTIEIWRLAGRRMRSRKILASGATPCRCRLSRVVGVPLPVRIPVRAMDVQVAFLRLHRTFWRPDSATQIRRSKWQVRANQRNVSPKVSRKVSPPPALGLHAVYHQ